MPNYQSTSDCADCATGRPVCRNGHRTMPNYELPDPIRARLNELVAEFELGEEAAAAAHGYVPCPSLACNHGYVQGRRSCPVCRGTGFVPRKES